MVVRDARQEDIYSLYLSMSHVCRLVAVCGFGKRMHVVVLDPGMVGRGGHHLAINRFLFCQAKKQGHRPVILTSNFFSPAKEDGFLGFPTFAYSPYTLQEHFIDNIKRFIVYNEETRTALMRRLPSKRLPKGSVFVIHTAFGCMLHGFLEYLLLLHRDDLHIRIVLRFPPSGVQAGKKLADEMWFATLQLWDKCPHDVRFYTDLSSLQRWYESHCPIKVGVTPIAVDFSSAPPPVPMRQKGGLVFGFVGVPREEKGILLIAAAIQEHLAQYPNDRFLLQTPRAEEYILEALSSLPEQVTLIDELLFEESYFSFIASLDVVLVPYLPDNYRMRTSHIFMEALGMGKAVITTPNTWMEEQLDALSSRCGVVMPSVDAAGMQMALKEIHHRRREIAENTAQLASEIRQKHCREAWYSYIMNGVEE